MEEKFPPLFRQQNLSRNDKFDDLRHCRDFGASVVEIFSKIGSTDGTRMTWFTVSSTVNS